MHQKSEHSVIIGKHLSCSLKDKDVLLAFLALSACLPWRM